MSVTVSLEYPIHAGGAETDTLTLRRIKMRDLKKFQKYKDDLERSIHTIADLAGIAPSEAEELDPVDFAKCGAVIKDFMGDAAE